MQPNYTHNRPKDGSQVTHDPSQFTDADGALTPVPEFCSSKSPPSPLML